MVKKRPAETGATAGAVVVGLVHFVFGVDDPDTLAWIGMAVGLLPAFITGLVAHGGIWGLVKTVWSGKRGR